VWRAAGGDVSPYACAAWRGVRRVGRRVGEGTLLLIRITYQYRVCFVYVGSNCSGGGGSGEPWVQRGDGGNGFPCSIKLQMRYNYNRGRAAAPSPFLLHFLLYIYI